MLKYYLLLFTILISSQLHPANYYVDSMLGNDSFNGLSESSAWKSINKINQRNFNAGDQILFKRGQTFTGKITLINDSGTLSQPIVISAYGDNNLPKPVINAGSNSHSINLQLCEYIEISNLEITGEGIEITAWGSSSTPEFFRNFHLHNLHIRNVNSSTAISFIVGNVNNRTFSDITIENCLIEDIIGAGITVNKWAGTNDNGTPNDTSDDTPATPDEYYHENLNILNNTIRRVNKAGIQIGKVKNALIKGNLTSNTGYNNAVDGSGSGLWTWYTKNLIAERNTFTGARGHTDSCGAHIDIGNEKNIFQYNLSIDNEGGFVELMGKNNGCIYRYNISINDGSRIKGVASPGTNYGNALQYGNVFWLGGYTGRNGDKLGPYYTYIYNNTIYTRSGITPNFQIENTAENVLIANNVLELTDRPSSNSNGQTLYNSSSQDKNLNYINNLSRYIGRGYFDFLDNHFNTYTPYNGNAQLVNRGGLSAADYIPQRDDRIVDLSVNLSVLDGDTVLSDNDLVVTEDFFGNPIIGQPDVGAIESTFPLWLLSKGMVGNESLYEDTNNDGITNLEAYAFDLNPQNNLQGTLPYQSLQLFTDTVSISHFSNAVGIIYQTYTSEDLTNWSIVNPNQVSELDASGFRTINIPLGEANKKFLKFELSIQ